MLPVTKDPQYFMKVKNNEWQKVRKCVDELIQGGKIQLPCLLSALELQQQFGAKDIHHSVFVIPDDTKEHGFKIGVAHRISASFHSAKTLNIDPKIPKKLLLPSLEESSSESYSNESGELGRGQFGIVQVIKWEDGSVDALKISEENSKENTDEEKILKKLDYLRSAFRDTEFVDIDLDNEKKLKAKNIAYSIQKLHPGMQAQEYFKQCKALNLMQELVMASKIIVAVNELHDKKIAHGDIHARNLLINCNGDTSSLNVKVIDFGKALDLSDDRVIDKKAPIKRDIIDIGRIFLQNAFKSSYLLNKGGQLRSDEKFDEMTLPKLNCDIQDALYLYKSNILKEIKEDLTEANLINIALKIVKKEVSLEGLLEANEGSELDKLGRVCNALGVLGSDFLVRVRENIVKGEDNYDSWKDIREEMEARLENILVCKK